MGRSERGTSLRATPEPSLFQTPRQKLSYHLLPSGSGVCTVDSRTDLGCRDRTGVPRGRDGPHPAGSTPCLGDGVPCLRDYDIVGPLRGFKVPGTPLFLLVLELKPSLDRNDEEPSLYDPSTTSELKVIDILLIGVEPPDSTLNPPRSTGLKTSLRFSPV